MLIGTIRLVHYLARRNLIDAYILQIAPLVLGSGLPFPKGTRTRLRLVQSMVTTRGVIIATYEPAESSASAVPSAQAHQLAVG
jgi:dihydrofolate reductase